MNKAMITGRLTRDPELRKTQTDLSVCTFTVAVDRRTRKDDEAQTADFIQCVAWKGAAEFVAKHFRKGSRIGITGKLTTRSYKDRDDRTVHVTEVLVEEVEFGESRQPDRDEPRPVERQDDDDDTALPFQL
jgi:single-strand DNA-binding protein